VSGANISNIFEIYDVALQSTYNELFAKTALHPCSRPFSVCPKSRGLWI